jgi:hypothetical protein
MMLSGNKKAGMVAATPAGKASRHSHNDKPKYRGGREE